MNEFFLLVLGLAGCWAIGALNKNVRLGLYLLAAMLTGFVGGAMYSHLKAKKTSSDMIITSNNVVIGSEESTVLFSESFNYDSEVPFSGILGKTIWNSDIQRSLCTYQHRVVWESGLSPPSYLNSS